MVKRPLTVPPPKDTNRSSNGAIGVAATGAEPLTLLG